MAVKKSNKDVGAKTIEINQAEYLVRGLGYIKTLEDLELAVVAVQDNVPIRVKDIAVVSLGPATRRGALDKDGAEVVGGVVVARYGSNPLQVINNVKDKIVEIARKLLQAELDYICETIFFILTLLCKHQGKSSDYVTEYLSLGIAPELEPV